MQRNIAFVFTFILGHVLFGQNVNNMKIDSAISKVDKLILTDARALFSNVESFIVYAHCEVRFEIVIKNEKVEYFPVVNNEMVQPIVFPV